MTGPDPAHEGDGPGPESVAIGFLPESVSAQVLLLYMALLGARDMALRLSESLDGHTHEIPDELIHSCDHLDCAVVYLYRAVCRGGVR